MIEYKTRYMEIPRNNLKPLDYFVNNSRVGERKMFSNAQEVESFIKEKYNEGWIFDHKVESELGFILYFRKEKE